MSSAPLFGSFINLGMAITAIVFMGILIHHNSTHRLGGLEKMTDRIDQHIMLVADRVPEAIACQEGLLEKNVSFINCTNVGNAQCEKLTDNFVASQGNLTTLTVESLNQTLNNVVESCTNQTNLLRMLIAEVNATNPPELLESGTSLVSVTGAASGFTAGWELYRLVLGGELDFNYLVLLPWNVAVTTASVNPVITYDALPFLSNALGTRFLLSPQQSKWTGLVVTHYGGNLKFYTTGSGSIQLTMPLSIQ